jgi:L-seryl-tRNA(Ser) seleniumtransferase
MNEKQKLLSQLPSVDAILKSSQGMEWLSAYPRRYVLQAIREVIDVRRKDIREGLDTDNSTERMNAEILRRIERLSSYSLRPLINATGVVIHTNLGRSLLSDRALENIMQVAGSYSNLEYDIEKGERGKRYSHIKRIISEVTGAEDALVVNNNAAAVLLCLTTLAKGKEVILSRGELVEIGGSFRMPDVMAASGAILREVGTTNKTHLFDYEKAINENTGLILKVHQSNFKVVGFTKEVTVEELAGLGKRYNIPVMFDLGSGCLMDLKPYGIHIEQSVQDVVKTDVDLTTFSGDKLLGGPQAGVIVGKKELIERLQKNPVTRAVRIDKMTLAGFEATLMEYLFEEKAVEHIPTLRMLLQKPEEIWVRAKKIASRLARRAVNAAIQVQPDASMAGGGALPETALSTYVVSIKPKNTTVDELEEQLRKGNPPVITRIRDDSLIIDARTVMNRDIGVIIERIASVLQGS